MYYVIDYIKNSILEDVDIMFLQNVSFYLRIRTALKP